MVSTLPSTWGTISPVSLSGRYTQVIGALDFGAGYRTSTFWKIYDPALSVVSEEPETRIDPSPSTTTLPGDAPSSGMGSVAHHSWAPLGARMRRSQSSRPS